MKESAAQNEMLYAQLRDRIRQAEKRPSFFGFMSEQACAAATTYVNAHYKDMQTMLWGGHPDAERKLFGAFPSYVTAADTLFPVAAVTLHYRKMDVLQHRDFLGAILGLGLARDAVGDILIEAGRCVVYVKEELSGYLLQNLEKIGRVGVQVTLGAEMPLPPMHSFVPVSGVVASERLDCLVGLLCKKSREQAAEMIRSGLVLLNHAEVTSSSARVHDGDILTMRKYGKFIIDRFGPQTGKGRLRVACRKYE